MPAVTRISDRTEGTCSAGLDCCPHGRSGTNAGGSPNVTVNGLRVHRKGDSGSCNCPHGGTFESAEGSPNVNANGQPITRIGDAAACINCGQIGRHASGSPNVTVNGA